MKIYAEHLSLSQSQRGEICRVLTGACSQQDLQHLLQQTAQTSGHILADVSHLGISEPATTSTLPSRASVSERVVGVPISHDMHSACSAIDTGPHTSSPSQTQPTLPQLPNSLNTNSSSSITPDGLFLSTADTTDDVKSPTASALVNAPSEPVAASSTLDPADRQGHTHTLDHNASPVLGSHDTTTTEAVMVPGAVTQQTIPQVPESAASLTGQNAGPILTSRGASCDNLSGGWRSSLGRLRIPRHFQQTKASLTPSPKSIKSPLGRFRIPGWPKRSSSSSSRPDSTALSTQHHAAKQLEADLVQDDREIKIGVGTHVWAHVGDEWVVAVVVKIDKPRPNAANIGSAPMYVVKHNQSRITLAREQLAPCEDIPLGTIVHSISASEAKQVRDGSGDEDQESLGQTLRLNDIKSTLHANDNVWVQLQRWSQGSVVAVQPQRRGGKKDRLLHEVTVNGKVALISRDRLFPVPCDAPPSDMKESTSAAQGSDGQQQALGATLLVSDFCAAANCKEDRELAATATRADTESTLEAGQRVWVRSSEWAKGVVLDVQRSRSQGDLQYSVVCEGQVYEKTRAQLRPLNQARISGSSAETMHPDTTQPCVPKASGQAAPCNLQESGAVPEPPTGPLDVKDLKQVGKDRACLDACDVLKQCRDPPLVGTGLHQNKPSESELQQLPPGSEQLTEDQHQSNKGEPSENMGTAQLRPTALRSHSSDSDAQKSVSESGIPSQSEPAHAPNKQSPDQLALATADILSGTEGHRAGPRPLGEANSAGNASDEDIWVSGARSPGCASFFGNSRGTPQAGTRSHSPEKHEHFPWLRSISPKRLPAMIQAATPLRQSINLHGNTLNLSASLRAFVGLDSKPPDVPEWYDCKQPVAESLGFGTMPDGESMPAAGPPLEAPSSALKQMSPSPEPAPLLQQQQDAPGRSHDTTDTAGVEPLQLLSPQEVQSDTLQHRFAICVSVHNGLRTLEQSTRVSELVLEKHGRDGWATLASNGPVDIGLVPQDVCCVIIAELLLLPARNPPWSNTFPKGELSSTKALRLGWTAFAPFSSLSSDSATICSNLQGGPFVTGPGLTPAGIPLISWEGLLAEACLQHGVKTCFAQQSLARQLDLYEGDAPFRISATLEGHGTYAVNHVADSPCKQSAAHHQTQGAAERIKSHSSTSIVRICTTLARYYVPVAVKFYSFIYLHMCQKLQIFML
jgi:hypothetical protein